MAKSKSKLANNPGDNPDGDSAGKWFLFAIVGIFVMGGLGIAAAVTLAGDEDIDDVDPYGDIALSGEPLSAMPIRQGITTADNDDAIGRQAPDITGTDFDGEEVSITADGRPKIVYFVSHGCPHCQVEVPMLVSLVEDGLLPEGLDIYAVSTGVDAAKTKYPPQRWLDDEGWTLPLIRDNEAQEALIAHGAGGYPYAVYLDGDNKLLFRSSGSLDSAITLELWNQVAPSAG